MARLERIFYGGTLFLAAALLVTILVLVVLQMISRVVGTVIPGIDEFAGYFVAGSLFLGLAHTLRADGHVRVQALMTRAPARVAWGMEVGATTIGLGTAILLAWSLIDFTWDSYRFGEVAHTLLPTPLWIPRTLMAFGAVCFVIALVHRLALLLKAGVPARDAEEHEIPVTLAHFPE